MPPILVIVIAIIVVAAVAYAAHVMERRRREMLLAWAVRRGWDFRASPGTEVLRRWEGLKVLQRGRSRGCRNLVTGRHDGFEISLLEYHYVTGSGKNRRTHRYALVVLGVDHPTIPLQVRRENPFDRVGEFLGMDDIDFESAEFSRRFYVTSSDKRWAYDVIHARAMDYLLGASFHALEFGFAELCVFRPGRLDPDRAEEDLRFARDLLDLVPDYVVRQMKGEK